MFSAIINLVRQPKYDFFGPETDELECIFSQDALSHDHLITGCNKGMERALVIHAMAQDIIQSKIRPAWLRHNGSVELKELRKVVQMESSVAEKLLNGDGFVKLSDLHIFDREPLEEWSQRARKESRCNPCPMENDEVKSSMENLVFSPALALRIQMGKGFDPRYCPEAFAQPANGVKANQFKPLSIKKPELALTKIQGIAKPFFHAEFVKQIIRISLLSIFLFATFYTSKYQNGLENWF